MTTYKKYAIRQGDTIQAIAQNLLGDATQWSSLVSYNKLSYPYINRLDEPKYRINSVLQVGDDLIVPMPDVSPQEEIGLLNSSQKELITEYALGRDLSIMDDLSDVQTRGTTDETLSLSASGRELDTVAGYNNLAQALIMRLNTPRGSLVLHPEYGHDMASIIGLPNTQPNVTKLLVAIEKAVRADERVADVTVNSTRVTEDEVYVTMEVTPLSFSEQFTLYLKTGDSSITLDTI